MVIYTHEDIDVLDGDMACLKGFLAQYYPRLCILMYSFYGVKSTDETK